MSGEPASRSPSWRLTLGSLIVHLRLPFQLLLAPVFLWGWLLAGGGPSRSVFVGFVAFHVFLYGGVTAFNSYYDRDEGPVAGLERPPPVLPALLPFSLAVKATGLALAALVNWPFFWLYGGFAALSVGYSHPRLRWKADPIKSVVVVALGQGVLAFLAGWAARRGELGSAWAPDAAFGAMTATLLILSLYPLTQVYQVDEDRARGDRTMAVAWGTRASFAFSLICLVLGGSAMVGTLYLRYGGSDALLVGTALLVQLAAVALWAAHFDESQVLANYRRVMRLNILAATGLTLYLAYHLLHG